EAGAEPLGGRPWLPWQGRSLLFASTPTTCEDRQSHERFVTHRGRLVQRRTRRPDCRGVPHLWCPGERRPGLGTVRVLPAPRPGSGARPTPAYGTGLPPPGQPCPPGKGKPFGWPSSTPERTLPSSVSACG